MRHKYILDENDIIKLIAERFNIDTKEIYVYYSSVLVGYGLDEHQENTINAEFTIEEKETTERLVENNSTNACL